ncbi:MAG: FAD-binding domain [Xanthomonadales bacterium]|nr:FAD-binding domain [Xanthomonadales bacterium]
MRIAISGAGIGGPTLAWWLREYGHTPVLIERAPAPRRGGYIIDYWGSGYEVGDRMGLIPALESDGYVVERLRSVTASGRTLSVLDARVFAQITNGRYLSIARSDLARRINEACAGIETRYDCTIKAVSQDADAARLEFSDGTRESFDLLVGADGLHSNTRALVFGPQSAHERRLGLHVAAMILDGYRPREELAYVQLTRPNRQISRFALHEDRTLFLFVFASDLLEDEPAEEAGQKAALRSIFTGLGWEADAVLARLDEVDDLYFDRVSQIELPRWSDGRVGLIGDAAACISLLGGEGSGLAMTEAYVLAGELQRARGDHRAAFAAYERRMQPYLANKQAGARRFKGFFAPKSWTGVIAREAMTALAALPFLTRRLLGAGLSDSMPLPDYGRH